MDLQTNLATMENVDFEEKVDIDDLVLPSELIKMQEMEIVDIKQEPLEGLERSSTIVHEGEKRVQKTHAGKKQYKLKIEETILKLYEELDREKYENPMMDFSQRRSLRIREVVDKLELCEKIEELECMNNQMAVEIVSLKAELQMVQNYFASIDSITKEIQNVKKTNQELSQKVQELENGSLERNNYVKPFSCKYCDKSFAKLHEVKEHIKIHASILETNDEVTSLATDNNFEFLKHPCHICGVQLAAKKTLQNHIKSVHEGKKEFLCSICNKDFAYVSSLKKHKKQVHDKVKFEFPQCESQLGCAWNLGFSKI